jgi:hypothetical protein
MLRRNIIAGALALAGCGGAGMGEETGATTQGESETGTTAGSTEATPTTTTPDETGSTGEPTIDGACTQTDRVGGFYLTMEEMYTALSGVVTDGVLPISVLEVVGEGGGCTLLRRNNPVCDPPCAGVDTCDFSGACIPYPMNHDVGTVTLAGLIEPTLTIEPLGNLEYSATNLMHPAFEPGAGISLTAAGGDYPGFSLIGEGVAMIEPASDALTMKKGEALALAWTPEDGAAGVRVELTIDQHGNSPVKLVCVGPDSGSLEVPVELIAQFIDFGISGFPSAQFYRETVDSLALEPGCVEFAVRSHRETLLGVEGHTPCNKPDDCPEGQTCDIMIQTCK